MASTISVAPLIEALVTRGHQVVVVSPFKNENLKDFQNYHHLHNENEYKKLLDSVMALIMKDNRMFSSEKVKMMINNPYKARPNFLKLA
jgi:UDP-glucose 6-dehydrogenase